MVAPFGEKEGLPSTDKPTGLFTKHWTSIYWALNIQPVFTEPTIYHAGLSKKLKIKN